MGGCLIILIGLFLLVLFPPLGALVLILGFLSMLFGGGGSAQSRYNASLLRSINRKLDPAYQAKMARRRATRPQRVIAALVIYAAISVLVYMIVWGKK